VKNDQPLLDASLNYQFGEELGSREPSSAVRGSKTIAMAVTVASMASVIGLFVFGQVVTRSATEQRLLLALFCDVLAFAAYTASFRLCRKGAHRSVIASGVLGGALLIAGALFALSVAA
jgi:hypothetical protein